LTPIEHLDAEQVLLQLGAAACHGLFHGESQEPVQARGVHELGSGQYAIESSAYLVFW
jgi:hypothetical protein